MKTAFGALLILSACAFAGVGQAAVSPTGRLTIPGVPAPAEVILRFEHSVKCTRGSKFPGVTGTAEYVGRRIRFELFEAHPVTEISLGSAPLAALPLRYELDRTPGCRAETLTPSIEIKSVASMDATEAQALRHSPFIVSRGDQTGNRHTDLPLLLVYSMNHNSAGNVVITYTAFFSDEDSKDDADATEGQMARYGRRADVEWVYRVELNSKDEIVSEEYQGSAIHDALSSRTEVRGNHDIGHTTSKFEGNRLPGPGNRHPVLYNIADNNVFSPFPDSDQEKREKLEGHHLVPRHRVDWPKARESAMFEYAPWTFRVIDAELAREGKLFHKLTAKEYLYVLVNGSLEFSSPANLLRGFRAIVKLDAESEPFTSGHGHSDVDRLGEDMWHTEAYTAVPLTRKHLKRITATGGLERGHLKLEQSMWANVELYVQTLSFYKLVPDGKTYRVEEITGAFGCSLGEMKFVECSF